MGNGRRRRTAVACQGSGSHTAFTARVLRKLLTREQEEYEFVALSGTSGGVICALLAWYGLLTGGRDEASGLLKTFWTRDNSANMVPERLLNDWIVRWQTGWTAGIARPTRASRAYGKRKGQRRATAPFAGR